MIQQTLTNKYNEKVKNHISIYAILSGIFIFLILISVCYACILAFYPFKTFDGKQIVILNKDKKVCAGDYLEWKIEYFKYINKSARVTRVLVNSYVINFDETTYNVPVGEGIYMDKTSIKIPENASPGIYKLRLTIVYNVNHLQESTVRVESENFEVRNSLLSKKQLEQSQYIFKLVKHNERLIKNNIMLDKKLIDISKETTETLKILKENQDKRIKRDRENGIFE